MNILGLDQGEKVVTLVSGGLDAACLLAWGCEQGLDQRAIYFNYGHDGFDREFACARANAHRFGVPLELVDLSGFRNSMLGRYDFPLNMGQNLLGGLLTSLSLSILCGSLGLLDGRDTLLLGIHKTDLTNRPQIGRIRDFAQEAMTYCLEEFSDRRFRMLFPFESLERTEVISVGASNGVDFSRTWSCQSNFVAPCGKCYSCLERQSAFRELGMVDPLAQVPSLV